MQRWKLPLVLFACLSSTIACASGGSSPGQTPGASGSSPAAVRVTEEPIAPDLVEEPAEEVPLPAVEEAPQAPEEAAPPPAPPSASETLAASLEAFESADSFWREGSFEDALAALDRAYELMASVEVNGDGMVAQEKEDLRRLISQRILDVYASRLTVAGEMEQSIPLEINAEVEREIRSFQGPERQSFLEGYERSGIYRPMILEQLREAHMPERLSWLPMVESWFKVRALSRARALGMWQFIASTGYRYGLQRNAWYDERMDPEKATGAALGYLTDLHRMFGDWQIALAAYNSGEARVQRILNRQSEGYLDRFWDLYQLLPGETRRYVPRFLATLAIVENPEEYGFDDLPQPLPALAYETVETSRSVRLADLDRQLELAEGTLAGLNPELRHKATPDSPYGLKVPLAAGATALAAVEGLPEAEPVLTTLHRVRRGETLSTIAQRYGSSVGALMRLNNLRNPNRIWPGQTLSVNGSAPPPSAAPGTPTTYTVRRGDSLWTIARRYGTTVDRIRRDNRLNGNTLQPGQRLRLNAGSGGSGTYVVRRGDTLGKIAQAHHVSLTALLRANGLSRASTIYPGQHLAIPR